MAKPWTNDEDNLLLALKTDNLSSSEIARRLGNRSVGAVRARLTIIAPNPRNWTEEERERAWKLKEAGFTHLNIARKLKRSKLAVDSFFIRDELNHYG